MRHMLLLLAFAGSLLLAPAGASADTLPLPANLVSLDSPEGEVLLVEAEARSDYFPLSLQFVTQNNQAFCGVASTVMVLNALKMPAPASPQCSRPSAPSTRRTSSTPPPRRWWRAP